MNELKELKNLYCTGKCSKNEYTDKMYQIGYSRFFEFQELIGGTCCHSIQIDEKEVVMTLKNGIKLGLKKFDKRLVPLEVLSFGDYEGDIWRFVTKEIGHPKTVLDIGGNIGYFSLYFSQVFPEASFHCFEPCDPTFAQLTENIKRNNAQRIHPYHFGLSEAPGAFEFYYDPECCGSSSFQNLLGDTMTKKVICQVKTIDDFVNEFSPGKIDFVKIDIEGNELFAIRGGLKMFERDHPIVFCEMLRKWSAKFGYHPNDIIALMRTVGYSHCYALAECGGMREIESVEEDTVETNFLFK